MQLCVTTELEPGGGDSGPLTFYKAGASAPHFCISYCVANIVTDNFILSY